MSTGRIIKKIEENSFDYKFLTIKRINCQYKDEKTKASFKANLKSLKDKKIVVYFSKLNIQVGRVMLTPDSVQYINYVDKNYFLSDYEFLTKRFNIDLDFDAVQSILCNNIFSYRNDSADKDFRNFTSFIDSGRYVIQSVKKRKLSKIEQKGKIKKAERILKRFDDEAFILQELFILPGSFNIEKMKIEDKSNNQLVEIKFDDYTIFKNKNYPGGINMNFLSGQGNVNMKIRLAGFSTDKIKSFNFSIPKKFERLEIN
jgi:hypothetical protein